MTRYDFSCGKFSKYFKALGFAIALNNDILDAVEFANLATGVVLRKAGTATVSMDEIQSDQVYLDRKIIERNLSCTLK